MIRVLLIHYKDSPSLGGSVRVGETLIRNLDPRKVEARAVFVYGEPGPVSAGLPVEAIFLRAANRRDPWAWLRLRKEIRRFQPDVIHYIDPVFWAHCAGLGFNAVRLLHLHGPWGGPEITGRERFQLHILKHTIDGYIAITDSSKQEMIRHGWAVENQSWVAYNAIDVAKYLQLPNRQEARKRFGIDPGCKLLVMLCRLTPSKGCGEGVRLLRYLPGDWQLLIAGDGHFRPDLERQAQIDGTAPRLHLSGWLDDPRWAYAAADAFLFLSHTEPFGLVLAEAMASGLPVFGLNGIGGYREEQFPLVTADNSFLLERPEADLLKNQYDGSMSADDSVLKALAAHIKAEWEVPVGIGLKTEAGRKWVTERFDGKRLAADVTAIYKSVLETRKGAGNGRRY